jgi:MraZ protein
MGSQFRGCALCEVDAEGNLLLSESTAQALGLPATDEPLVLSAHERDQCLVGYASTNLQEIRTRSGVNAKIGDASMQRMLGIVAMEPRNARGLTLPTAMRQHGRIESVALVVGAGDRFEIWNPQLAATQNGVGAAEYEFPPIIWRHPPRGGSRRARPARY